MKGFQEGLKEAFQEAAVLLARVTLEQEPSVALYLLSSHEFISHFLEIQ